MFCVPRGHFWPPTDGSRLDTPCRISRDINNRKSATAISSIQFKFEQQPHIPSTVKLSYFLSKLKEKALSPKYRKLPRSGKKRQIAKARHPIELEPFYPYAPARACIFFVIICKCVLYLCQMPLPAYYTQNKTVNVR
jgi:hypothetical protein